MEIDDDYESFSFPNSEPSPSPKHRRLKRLKKSTVVADESAPVESVSDPLDLPRVDFASLEALESSDIRAFDDSSEPILSPPAEGFDGDGDGDGKGLSSGFDDTLVNGDRKETKRSLDFGEGFDDDAVKEKELSTCYDDTRVISDPGETKGDLESEDDGIEKKLSSGVDDMPVRTDRKDTKRALEFDDEIIENGLEQRVEKEAETANMESKDHGEKEVVEDAMNEKKEKKKRLKSSSEDPKAKNPSSNKRREAKERRAHLDQLHAESQRILRETRGASFKPVPLVQKPISSILDKIRQRKLEVSKKFSQFSCDDSVKEDDSSMKHTINHSESVEIEVEDLPESVKEDKVSSGPKEESVSDAIDIDEPNISEEHKNHDNASSQMALDEESTPVLRAPVDDTQELFGDSQTSDSTESKDEEPDEHTISSQEEEMKPSLLTMKLKFDSVPDDISDEEEEENDKENVNPHVDEHVKDPVKSFLDDEAEEEDDSDNDRMRFGDDSENEDDDDDDMEELREMIATGYEEKPVDKETRDELHQKWLEEKDAAGTDDLLRRLNVASKFREGSILDDDEGEDDVDVDVDVDDDDVEEDEERPRVRRLDSKKAKEMIAQMFVDKDEGFVSSDDEETEKILAKERLFTKSEERSKLLSPDEDEDSREIFGLIKKLNTAPDPRKKAKTISFIDPMLTGGNSNSSSKSSFLSRASNLSVPTTSSKQGSSRTGVSFIFGRDDSNSRSSISISNDTSDTTTKEIQTKKVTAKYSIRSSSQTTKLVNENSRSNSSTSFFEILKRSSSDVGNNKESSVVELSQSVFAAFKIPKKPIKIQGRV